MFVWEDRFGVAPDFKNQGAVRGHIGFHAAWPQSLAKWPDSPVDHSCCKVKALVKGSGDLVLGEEGWRSEKLEIVSIVCEKVKELLAAYDGVTGIQGTPRNNLASEDCKIVWLVSGPEALAHPRLRRKMLMKGLLE